MGELRSLIFNPAYSPFFNEDEVMNVLSRRSCRRRTSCSTSGRTAASGPCCSPGTRAKSWRSSRIPGRSKCFKETIAVNRARNVTACDGRHRRGIARSGLLGHGQRCEPPPGQHRPSTHSRAAGHTRPAVAAGWTSLPDVLKIDVEGAEQQVLSGATHCLAHARLVCIEVHFDELPKFGAATRRWPT